MDFFENVLSGTDRFKRIKKAEDRGTYPIQLNGCVDSQICHMMTMLAKDKRLKLIVTYSEERARKLYDDLRSFDRHLMLYPAKDALFFSADIHGSITQLQRLEIIKEIVMNGSATVVTTIDGGLDRVIPLEVYKRFLITVNVSDTLDFKAFAVKLTELGYERKHMVDSPGQYAIRGGIMDVYPVGEESPVRIELWDDEVDTIRSFDVDSQRSIEQLDRIDIFAATEMPMYDHTKYTGREAIEAEYDIAYKHFLDEKMNSEAYNLKDSISRVLDMLETDRLEAGIDSFISYFYDETVSLIDYFNGDDGAIFYDEPSWILEALSEKANEFNISMDGRLKSGYILEGQKDIYFKEDEIIEKLKQGAAYYFSRIGYDEERLPSAFAEEVRVSATNTYKNHMDILIRDMKKWQKDGYRILFLSPSSSRAARLARELEENDINAYFAKEPKDEVLPSKTLVTVGSLSSGFIYLDEKVAILSEDDIIRNKRKRKRRIKPRYKGDVIKNFDDLNIGDYVVHEDRGVGIYRGIVSKTFDDVSSDYISIEYAGGAMFYINVNGMDRGQRYAGGESNKAGEAGLCLRSGYDLADGI